MNENKSIAIVFSMFFISVAGCCSIQNWQAELTQRQIEKTNQIKIQARIDSIMIVNKNFK